MISSINFFIFLLVVLPFMAEAKQKTIVVVSLADNVNQGIVPVPGRLGDGRSLRNNLYWGAFYGAKTVFKKSKKFKLESCARVDKHLLERCVFSHVASKSKVTLEAYAGDMQQKTLEKYFEYLSANQDEEKLVAYVGHNSLMEINAKKFKAPQPGVKVMTSVLACQSKSYFENILNNKNINQVVMTKTNMAPESYIVEALLDGYFQKLTKAQIKNKVVESYAKYQKISNKAAKTVFF